MNNKAKRKNVYILHPFAQPALVSVGCALLLVFIGYVEGRNIEGIIAALYFLYTVLIVISISFTNLEVSEKYTKFSGLLTRLLIASIGFIGIIGMVTDDRFDFGLDDTFALSFGILMVLYFLLPDKLRKTAMS